MVGRKRRSHSLLASSLEEGREKAGNFELECQSCCRAGAMQKVAVDRVGGLEDWECTECDWILDVVERQAVHSKVVRVQGQNYGSKVSLAESLLTYDSQSLMTTDGCCELRSRTPASKEGEREGRQLSQVDRSGSDANNLHEA
jgi:hypothetical protein